MASSLGIACAGSNPNFIQKRCGVSLRPPSSVAMKRSTTRITAAMSIERERRMSVVERNREGGTNEALEGQERLDRWIRQSVAEIVKNLREAPLLVHVYPKIGTKTIMASIEKNVVVEDWPAVKEKWENGEEPVPEGVIFVEELSGDETTEDGRERTTKAWGVVVQGKGVGCGPVCYLLKTSRVGSGSGPGMGICSTHFCLVKVKDFRETVQSQLKNCWLLKSQCQWQQ